MRRRFTLLDRYGYLGEHDKGLLYVHNPALAVHFVDIDAAAARGRILRQLGYRYLRIVEVLLPPIS